MERLLQRERPRVQRQLQRLQKKLQRERQRRQQLEAQIQQAQGSVEMMSQPMQQHLLLQHLLWQQRQQQQYLHHQQWQHLLHQQQQQQQFLLQHQQQYLLQQQAHFHGMQQQQQQLSLPAGEQQQQQALLQRDQEKAERSVQQQAQQVTPPERPAQKRKQGRPQEAHLPGMQQQQQQLSLPAGEQQQQQALLQQDQEKGERPEQQQAQQVTPPERRPQKRKQHRPRRAEQAEELPPKRGLQRALRPATQTSGQSLEDEWIRLLPLLRHQGRKLLEVLQQALEQQRIVRTTPAELLINLRRGVTAWPGRRDLMPLLVEARELLSKQFLYFDDMEKLAHVAEALIEHGTNHQRQDLSEHSPTRAVERLGMRFLLMDAVVSAFIVLGQKPDEKLWKSFTDAINHKPPLGHFYGMLGGRETWASQALQLSRAIETLKTGKRPKAADLVHLKRMLICSPSSHPRFKKPDFNPWRQDNSEGADGE
ncbi:uncharacterized protein EMH_0079990 [Eimeria mitis]|uniref:Uncharacterized protein n=1 Tax=Eimeria mitis TaxID=44415 RepID=U6KA40_9EIME|nr:uncharacterized protein EMH_0079990 [Eimeria mitis]CDJ33092.1 hypothetical protein EMH_0079990 [Eimeria mitis]